MSTLFPTKNHVPRKWHVIDAQDAVVGKIATKAAMILMGKTKPVYTPFIDTGDHVIVINASKARLSRAKQENKVYRHFHRSYPGGLGGKELQARCAKEARPHY